MMGVFGLWRGSVRSVIGVLLSGLWLVACAGSGSQPPTATGTAVPTTLDGLWLLEGTTLQLDIDIETATVDGSTDCGRMIGSLTFRDRGEQTSFSLPGQRFDGCSDSGQESFEDIVDLLEMVQSAEAEPGAFVLRDGSGSQLGRLRTGN